MRHRAAVPVAPLTLVPLVLAMVLAGAPPVRAGNLGFEAHGGYFGLQATRSAQAVFDDSSTGGATFGGAVRYVHRTGVFLAAGARTFSKDGQRVFVAARSGPVARLGFPLQVRITPVFGTLGYRFQVGLVAPYLGVGGGVTMFKERSDVAGDVRSESRRKGALHALLGLEVGRGLLRLGAEGVYSTVADGIGLAGVSSVYREDNLGGFSVLGKVVVSLGR